MQRFKTKNVSNLQTMNTNMPFLTLILCKLESSSIRDSSLLYSLQLTVDFGRTISISHKCVICVKYSWFYHNIHKKTRELLAGQRYFFLPTTPIKSFFGKKCTLMKGLCHFAGILYISMLLRALDSSVHSSDDAKYFAVYFHLSVLCFWRGEMMGVRIKAQGGRFSLVRRLGGLKQRFAYSPQEGAVNIAQIAVLPCKHVLFCCGISGFKYNLLLCKHFFLS